MFYANKEFFDYCNVKISSAELYTLLDEMISEGLLFINTQWMNEKNEYPFALTALGKLRWKDIKE